MLPLVVMYENQVIPKGIKPIIQYWSSKNKYSITSIKNTINQIYNQKQSTKHNKKTIIKDNQNSIKKQSTTTINQL